jgi:hypothetical protein
VSPRYFRATAPSNCNLRGAELYGIAELPVGLAAYFLDHDAVDPFAGGDGLACRGLDDAHSLRMAITGSMWVALMAEETAAMKHMNNSAPAATR